MSITYYKLYIEHVYINFQVHIIIIYPLTTRVVGAPQMISQPSLSNFVLFSTALWDLANSRLVHSLMLSSHLLLCLPCLLPPFTLPCKMVLARPDKQQTCPYHCSLCLFTMVRRSLCGPIACWILAQTSSLVDPRQNVQIFEVILFCKLHTVMYVCMHIMFRVHQPTIE